MRAVYNNEDWNLIFPDIESVGTEVYTKEWNGAYKDWEEKGYPVKIYKTVKARELYDLICRAVWECGDPGLLFVDAAQKWTPVADIPQLIPKGTNPCGEQWMPDWGNCLLVAINLPNFVINPYKNKEPSDKESVFDFSRIKDVIEAAVYFANVVSQENSNRHPYQQQRDMDEYSRRIGIEVTGLADVFAMLGIAYGTEASIKFTEELFQFKALCEIYASWKFTKQFGVCKVFKDLENRKKFVDSNYIDTITHTADAVEYKYIVNIPEFIIHKHSSDIKKKIMKDGLCNSAFNTIGPCGSISIVADNCTSGIEPLFAYKYKRKVTLGGKVKEYSDEHYLAKKHGGSEENYRYSEAHMIHYEHRLRVQAAAQFFTDASISSTINLRNSATVEDINNLYRKAHICGLKGITVFRDGCKVGILEKVTPVDEHQQDTNEHPQDTNEHTILYKRSLLDVEDAERHKVIWKKGKVYVIVSLDDTSNPIEIFAKLPRQAGFTKDGVFEQDKYNENTANWDCINRLISIMLRYNIPLSDIIDQLDKSSCSLVDAPGVIKRVLLNYLDDGTIINQNDANGGGSVGTDELQLTNGFHRTPCPNCGNQDLYTREGGCYSCKGCGYSKCD
jgi:ribonucleoside-diphosphate reductase alpha chain